MSTIKGVSPLLQVYDMSVALEFYLKLGFDVIDSAPSLKQCEWCLIGIQRCNISIVQIT